MSQSLLVTGASGQLGRLVIAHLIGSEGVDPATITAATRDPAKIADLAAQGVRVVAADFDDPATLASAFAGIDRLLLVSTDALDAPGRRLAQHVAAVSAAKAAGVKHIVYTSMPGPEDSLISFAPDHLGTEQAVKASGLGWTILRNSWYFENLLGSLPGVLQSGKWFTSAGPGRAANLSREDCARAAAAALVREGSGETWLLTGPEALTTEDIAAAASDVFGKPIEVIQVTDAELTAGMVAHGIPEVYAQLWTAFDANTRAGKVGQVTDAVKRLTGVEPISIRDYLAANRTAFGA